MVLFIESDLILEYNLSYTLLYLYQKNKKGSVILKKLLIDFIFRT